MTLAILIHSLVFLAFWLTNLPYQTSLNNFLIAATGRRMNFLLIFMLFAGLAALWSAARLILARRAHRSGPAWPYLAVGVFFLVFFYGSFAVLFLNNPVQFYRLGQLFQYFRFFIDAGLLLTLAWGLPRRVKINGARKKLLLPASLLVLWLIPVFWTPGNVYRGALPEKPRLIAHRGLSALAPENTLAAMQAAVDLGVYGLESDISVSADGVFFLMHDNTLGRTTDVAGVFPERIDDPAETFTWSELSRLDAANGFDGSAEFTGEPIPTLKAVLQKIKKNNLHFIYDLRIPAAGHPYSSRTLELCLDEIQAGGVAGNTWVLAKPGEIARIRSTLPDAILAAEIGYKDTPPSPESLASDGYSVVNSVYGLSSGMIQAYRKAGLWVNLWVVDEPWQFSRLWLAGADSVATGDIQGFLALSRPVLALPYGVYLSIWGLLGVLAGGVYWRSTRK
jgi:glycerophosphoryl diester phosphodiesterase